MQLDQPSMGGLSSGKKKRSGLLWDALSGFLTLDFFHSSSWIPESFKIRTDWSDTSMVCPCKSNILLRPSSIWVWPGLPYHQNGYTVLQLLWRSLILLFKWPALLSYITYAFNLYKHLFQPSMEPGMKICSVLLFWSPQERRSFSSPSLAHPQVVDISEICCVRKHLCLFGILKYFVYNPSLYIPHLEKLQYFCL